MRTRKNNISADFSQASGGTSPSLLLRLREDDSIAWSRAVSVYSPLIFVWCRRSGLSSEDAADAMQEVWAAVSAAISRFDYTEEGATFRGWLYTITRHKLADLFRRLQRTPAALGGDSAHGRWLELPEIEPEESLADSETGHAGIMRRAVEAIRHDFEPLTFRAFWETAIEGRSARDVANEIGVSTAVVYQSKSRVLRRLRTEFQMLLQA